MSGFTLPPCLPRLPRIRLSHRHGKIGNRKFAKASLRLLPQVWWADRRLRSLHSSPKLQKRTQAQSGAAAGCLGVPSLHTTHLKRGRLPCTYLAEAVRTCKPYKHLVTSRLTFFVNTCSALNESLKLAFCKRKSDQAR